jgi:NTE family protein
MPTFTLENWLKEKPFELFLGAGFFGFYAHAGFIKALEEKKLLPAKIHGSSAGAIVGAMLAHSYPAKKIEEIVLEIQREDFWDPSLGLGLLKGKKYEDLLSRFLPKHFHELSLPLEISVFDIKSLKNKTMISGELLRAVRASSAFPVLFQPVKIENKYYMDGGLYDLLPPHDTRLLAHSFKKLQDLKKTNNHVTISLKNLPRSGPYKMHLGKDIIEKSYELTSSLLEKDLG